MFEEIEKQIADLIKKAANAINADDAMKYAQAARNASDACFMLNNERVRQANRSKE